MIRRLRLIVSVLALSLAVIGVRNVTAVITATTPRVIDLERLPTIILDAGHGGIDGGAVSPGGVLEKDLNLAITLDIRDLFLACGFEVVMTREDDRSIHDEGVKGTARQKTSDIHNRLAIAEKYYPNAIFLSIHQNKFQDSSSHGAQIFYSPNNEYSEQLAKILQDTIIEMVQPENSRKIKKAGDNLYLMDHARCPAVLIECGFLSNREDTLKLQDPDYQKEVSFAIVSSVLSYLELDAPTGVSLERGV